SLSIGKLSATRKLPNRYRDPRQIDREERRGSRQPSEQLQHRIPRRAKRHKHSGASSSHGSGQCAVTVVISLEVAGGKDIRWPRVHIRHVLLGRRRWHCSVVQTVIVRSLGIEEARQQSLRDAKVATPTQGQRGVAGVCRLQQRRQRRLHLVTAETVARPTW